MTHLLSALGELVLIAIVVCPFVTTIRMCGRVARVQARAGSLRVYARGVVRSCRVALSCGRLEYALASDTGGAAMELLTGFVTAPSTTQTALGMATGDSLNVRATATPDKLVQLLQVWFDNQTAGVGRVKSPRMHDNVQGIRLRTGASETKPRMPWSQPQRLYQMDALSVDLSGSATAGDIETAALLLFYEDLGGIAQTLIGVDELAKRANGLMSQEIQITAGTAGGWSGSRAVNADFDNWVADKQYALVGYQTDTEVAAVAFKGADTGNLRVGGPGDELAAHLTNEWFIRLSRLYGRPLIPVFKSQNKGGITVEVASDENAASPKIIAQFVQLS